MKVVFEINKKLSKEQCEILLAGIGDEEWQAVRQILLTQIEEATQIAVDPGTVRDHGLVAYYNGQVEATRLIFGLMEEIRAKNKTIRDEDPLF